MDVRPRGRGEREPRHWGSGGFDGRGIRGSNDIPGDPADEEHDPCPDLRDDSEDLQDPANDEYIWPTPDEEEDD